MLVFIVKFRTIKQQPVRNVVKINSRLILSRFILLFDECYFGNFRSPYCIAFFVAFILLLFFRFISDVMHRLGTHVKWTYYTKVRPFLT